MLSPEVSKVKFKMASHLGSTKENNRMESGLKCSEMCEMEQISNFLNRKVEQFIGSPLEFLFNLN